MSDQLREDLPVTPFPQRELGTDEIPTNYDYPVNEVPEFVRNDAPGGGRRPVLIALALLFLVAILGTAAFLAVTQNRNRVEQQAVQATVIAVQSMLTLEASDPNAAADGPSVRDSLALSDVPVGTQGVAGLLEFCDPAQTTYTVDSDICVIERMMNTLDLDLALGMIGVQYIEEQSGAGGFHTSMENTGLATVNVSDTSNILAVEDSFTIAAPGTYQMYLALCFSEIESCKDGAGQWETLVHSRLDVQITQ